MTEPIDREEPPVQVARLRASLADLGNPAVFRELLTVFLTDTPGRLAALRAALAAADGKQVRHVAHTLKGTCGYLGAQRLVRICREMEEASGARDVARALALMGDLDAEYQRVRVALEQELQDSSD